MVLLAILLAWLTYRLIERPIRFNQKTFFTPARLFITGIVFFCVSSYVYINSGLPNRAAAQLTILNFCKTQQGIGGFGP
jgi:peptidoglycan/LPS O-acetylase OafA/YrhL